MTRMTLAISAALLCAASGLITTVRSQAIAKPGVPGTELPNGASDFDFQRGEWRVHHRVKRPGQEGWTEFDGTCRNRGLIACLIFNDVLDVGDKLVDALRGLQKILSLVNLLLAGIGAAFAFQALQIVGRFLQELA